jgi:hypothetical protein
LQVIIIIIQPIIWIPMQVALHMHECAARRERREAESVSTEQQRELRGAYVSGLWATRCKTQPSQAWRCARGGGDVRCR